jgi:hypothetical protein
VAEPSAASPAWRLAPIVGVVLLAAIAGGYGIYLHGRISAGLEDAATRAEAAERDAAASRAQAREEVAAVRQAAEERLASAEQAASSAQLLATIVAAPDAKRFELTGSTAAPAVQVLWSRSRGVAASAGPLPTLPAGRTYQLWMVTRGAPASAGLLPPSTGRPTNAVFPWPADLRRAVVGAMITVEPAAGSRQPTGPPWLVSRAPTPSTPPVPPTGNGS